jgi:ParB/RepB/Spo0J family partition protein
VNRKHIPAAGAMPPDLRDGQLISIPLDAIQPNPHRNLQAYPAEEERVLLLADSIKDVGWFPGGVTVRANQGKYQLAFGHKRLEAARRVFAPNHKISVIIRKINDEEMLKLMARENVTETDRNFLVMLETWEATIRFLKRKLAKEPKQIEISSFLGWRYRDRVTPLSTACNAAHSLIENGIVDRRAFAGLRITQALELAQSLNGRLRAVTGKIRALQPEQIKREKTALAEHAKTVVSNLHNMNERTESQYNVRTQLLRAERGKANLPDFVAAVRLTRRRVAMWAIADLEERIKLLCEVAIDINTDEKHHLRYLGKEIQTLSQRLAKQAELIEMSTAHEHDIPALELTAARLESRKLLEKLS